MPRVRVATPTTAQAATDGRAFAVLHQLKDASGVIDPEVRSSERAGVVRCLGCGHGSIDRAPSSRPFGFDNRLASVGFQ